MEEENKKGLTLEEYQEKYSKPENLKKVKLFVYIGVLAIGIIIFTCLFFMVLRVFDINEIAGYISIGVAVLIFTFAFIVPLIIINKEKAFITNLSEFYSDEKIGKLAIARQTNNNEDVKVVLTEIYKTDVKNAANRMIRNTSLQVGLFTALSQSEKIDTLLTVTFELKLIKDLVYLYGFRPSDAKMYKIYRTVVVNSLVAYGVATSLNGLGGNVVALLSKTVGALPVLGNAIGTVIDSAVQGAANASLAAILGFQTIRYLNKEYKLQDILDSVIISDEEQASEEKAMIASVSGDIKGKAKINKKAVA